MSASKHGTKFAPAVRRELILIAAVRVARQPGGWQSLTRTAVADAAECSPALVSRTLGDMDSVRASVMKRAIRYQYLDLIAQGLAAGYPQCLRLSPVLKHKAVSQLVG